MMTQMDNRNTDINDVLNALHHEQNARIELERELHLMHLFVRRAGHDLKTPITTLKTSLYLLQRKPDLATPERLNMMEAQLDRLSNLIDAMGLMARLEDLQDLTFDEDDIGTVITEAIWDVTENAKAREIVIVQDFADDLPRVAVNYGELKRALVNLLDNAIRYSQDDGAVFVRVFEMHGYLCVDVTDTGVGVAPEEINHLFERFYRGNDSSSRADLGAGMGLPIVQRIVELHSGKIRVMTQAGEGSTFRVMLPIISA